MKGLIIILLLVITFFSCAKQDRSGVLTLYWNPDHLYDAYNEVISEFCQEKNIKFRKHVFSWDEFKTKIKTDFFANTPPDLIEVPAPWISEFAAMGQLSDLTEDIRSWDEHTDWFESAWTETTLNSKIYGVKLHHTAFGLFYNKEHFRRAGLDPENPPRTLEEMIACIKIIKTKLGKDIKGFGFDPTGQYLMPFLANKKTLSLIRNNRMAIDTPHVRATLEKLQALANSGDVYVSEPGGESARQNVRLLFFTGKISMMISGPWEISNIKKNFASLDYGVAMVPHLKGMEPRTLTAGTGLAIPKGAKIPKKLVFELIKRLTAKEVAVNGTLNHGMLYPRKSWLKDSRIQKEKSVRLFGPLLGKAVPFDIDARKKGLPELTWGGSVFKSLYDTMIYTRDNMHTALDKYVKEGNKLLAEK